MPLEFEIGPYWNNEVSEHTTEQRSGDGDSDDSLISLSDDDDDATKPDMITRLYAAFLAKVPFLIPLIVVGVTVGCAVLSWKNHPPPDFGEDPTKGFETRGTHIQTRAWTQNNIYNHIHNSGDLLASPNQAQLAKSLGVLLSFLSNIFSPVHNRGNESPVSRRKRSVVAHTYCDPLEISSNAPIFLFEAYDGVDLLSLGGITSMCEVEKRSIAPLFQCPLKSLTNFIGNMTNKDCKSLQEADVELVRGRLADCADFYYNGSIKPDGHLNSNVPAKCFENHYVYLLFYNILPIGFMRQGSVQEKRKERLVNTVTYADLNNGFDWTYFYKENFEGKTISHDGVRLAGLHLPGQKDVKYDIFNDFLLHDTLYFIVAAVLVVVIMLLYLRSVVLTLATFVNVAMSFIIAYTIYFAIPSVNFFPFMNLLVALVLIAVGADDVFIFHDTWEHTKEKHRNLPMKDMMAITFSHAALSVTVTSLTTAAAFFANTVSQITDIKCFGIFAGIAILVNYVLMLTWTPSVILCCDYVWNFVKGRTCPNTQFNYFDIFTKFSQKIFHQGLPKVIEKGWFFWIFALVGIGAGASVVVFVKPKLNLPTTKDFQLFPEGNLLEYWDLKFSDKFQSVVDKDKNQELSVWFVWGFDPADDGNYLDPDDKNDKLRRDDTFDFYPRESQIWMNQFCTSLKNASFVSKYYKHYGCMLQTYSAIAVEFCSKHENSSFFPVISKCCNGGDPSFDPDTLKLCGPALQLLLAQDYVLSGYTLGWPVYDNNNNVIGLQMHVQTTFYFSNSYEIMHDYYSQIQNFVDEQLATAPSGVDGVFFNAWYDFTFYDLQKAISRGLYFSIVLSLSVALVVMFLTSLNLLITLYALFTISLAILCTIAAIVFMGWELNILESITINLAVGLSIDFAIHYGVAYRLSRQKFSLGRMTESFTRVGSAVAMAALTTFVAGAAVMPSHILAYKKLGIFLMLVMAFSWFFSTFLFQSICRIIGPRGNFCQISMACLPCSKRKVRLSERNLNEASLQSIDASMITF